MKKIKLFESFGNLHFDEDDMRYALYLMAMFFKKKFDDPDLELEPEDAAEQIIEHIQSNKSQSPNKDFTIGKTKIPWQETDFSVYGSRSLRSGSQPPTWLYTSDTSKNR